MQERFVEGDVDETGPGDLEGRLAAEISRGNHRFGDFAWLAIELLGEGEGAIGLGVGTLARPHHRIDRFAARR